MRNCEFCEGLISERAKKCKHCGEWVGVLGTENEEIEDLNTIAPKTSEGKVVSKNKGFITEHKVAKWSFFISFIGGIILLRPSSSSDFGELLAISGFSLLLGTFFSWLFTIKVKDKNSKMYKNLVIFGYGLGIFLVLGGQISS